MRAVRNAGLAAAAGVLLAAGLLPACGGPQQRRVVYASPGDEHGDYLGADDDGRVLERTPVVVAPLPRGVVLPYPIDRVFGTFGDCRDGGRRQHRGLDLGGVGPLSGLGTPIRSMVRARITFIGTPHDDPARFGTPDTRAGTTERGGTELPRQSDVPGYGRVHWFTRDYGSWRSGVIVVTEGVGPPLDGHVIRYLHLGAVQPNIAVGDLVEAGQEIGLMGGTAIQQDSPHVHIDITDPDGDRVDVAPWLGMAPDNSTCRR